MSIQNESILVTTFSFLQIEFSFHFDRNVQHERLNFDIFAAFFDRRRPCYAFDPKSFLSCCKCWTHLGYGGCRMSRERWYIILKTSVNKLEVICFQKKFGSNGFDCISCSQQCTFYFAFSTLFNGYSLFCSISTWNITAFFPYIHLGYLLFWWWLLPFLVSFLRLFRSFSCLNAQDYVVC